MSTDYFVNCWMTLADMGLRSALIKSVQRMFWNYAKFLFFLLSGTLTWEALTCLGGLLQAAHKGQQSTVKLHNVLS